MAALPETFKIDEIDLYKSLGHDAFVQLSTAFYNRVYSDPDETFRSIFAGRPKDQAIQNQYEFFIERMGGPNLYTSRKGNPALRARHKDFRIDKKAAERWLFHMRGALDERKITGENREALDQFFEHTALFLRNVD